MKSLIIVGIAALVAGVAGGTGFRLATAPPLPAAVQAAEPAQTDPDPEDQSVDPAAADPAVDHGEDTAPFSHEESEPPDPPAVTGRHRVEAAARQAQGEDEPESTSPARRGATADYRQLARILGNMKAAEAERILEHMNDDQVASILASMGARQAATLLAAIPPARAAAIGRALVARGGAESP